MAKKSLVSLCLYFALAGCVTKGTHLKIVRGLQDQIVTLQKKHSEADSELHSQKQTSKDITSEKNSLAKQKAILVKRLSLLRNREKDCIANLKSMAEKGGKMSQKLGRAIEQIQQLQELADKRKALFEKLKSSFRSMVDAGKLKVNMVRGMLTVQLAEKILFDTGRYSVKKEGKEAIAEVTKILMKMKRRWQVTGHTDSKGSPLTNWTLSTNRAMAVLQVMLKDGMPAELISVAGFGQYQPVAPNDTKENRALNRRTDLVLIPNLKELQLVQAPSPFWACQAFAAR